MSSPTKSAIACVLFFAFGMLAGSFIEYSLEDRPEEEFGWEKVLDRASGGGDSLLSARASAPKERRVRTSPEGKAAEPLTSRLSGFWRSSVSAQDYRDSPSPLGPNTAVRAGQGGAASRGSAAPQPRTPAAARAQSVMPPAAGPGREAPRFVSTLPGIRSLEGTRPREPKAEAAVQERASRERRGSADFDGREAHPWTGSSGMAGSGLSPSSLDIQRRDREKEKQKKGEEPPEFKPPLFKDWIPKKLKPPEGRLEAPSFSKLKDRFPKSLPDGRIFERGTPPAKHVEGLLPPGEMPEYERWLEKDRRRGRKDEPHWHIGSGNIPFYHMGKVWGRADNGRWTWMALEDRRWWTVADGAQRMVRHAEHWWWKTPDGWFMLHQGEPWAWRHFAEWRRDGLIHPKTETRVVYSQDGARVALIFPGAGSMVFDAATGRFLGRFPETGIGEREGD